MATLCAWFGYYDRAFVNLHQAFLNLRFRRRNSCGRVQAVNGLIGVVQEYGALRDFTMPCIDALRTEYGSVGARPWMYFVK